MEDKTVIITALNKAWAASNSMFDLFLQSFRIGIGTERLVKHVVGVCVENKAYDRCLQVHPHCYFINATDSEKLAGPNRFRSPGYLALIWRRMDFLEEVIALGYNFIFTDADILWFYEFWYGSRRRFRRRKHDQDIFNFIKKDPYVAKIGIKIRFLDTVYFGGFCEPSKDVNVVNTRHSNCCIGLNNKIRYLNDLLRDWKQYLSESLSGNTTLAEMKWNFPHRCGRHWR